eukprot:11994946-Alexandrium_andersonii.AAC.1
MESQWASVHAFRHDAVDAPARDARQGARVDRGLYEFVVRARGVGNGEVAIVVLAADARHAPVR